MEVILNWIGGATFILEVGKLKIACDPVLCPKDTIQDYFWFKSKRVEEPHYDEKTFSDIDLWLITHNHEDHIDHLGLSKIDQNSKVVSNRNASKELKKKGILDLTILDWHKTVKFSVKDFDIQIEAIPAIHGINPVSAFMAGKVNGYYLTISKANQKLRIYITSDTVYKSRIINSFAGKEIELLIPNMGAAKEGSWIMTLTLNANMLRKMISKLNPKAVIPVHYGTFEHYVEPVSKIEDIKDARIKFLKAGESVKLKFVS